MNPATRLLGVVCLLFIMSAAGAGPNRVFEISDRLVGKAVAWQAHWDRDTATTYRGPLEVAFKVNGKSEVWIDEFQWIISFDETNGEFYPYLFQRAYQLPEEMQRDALLAFAHAEKRTVKIPNYTNSFRKISLLNADSRRKLLETFKDEAGSADRMIFYREQLGPRIKRIRFWIAPVDLAFPVILYAVEGVPYFGKVYFGTRSLNPLYSELKYIGDSGTTVHDQGVKLINSIKAEGEAFDLENGRLTIVRN